MNVKSQGSQGLNLKVTPPPGVAMGVYDLIVTAVGGGESVEVPLQVEITGTYTMTMTTPTATSTPKSKRATSPECSSSSPTAVPDPAGGEADGQRSGELECQVRTQHYQRPTRQSATDGSGGV